MPRPKPETVEIKERKALAKELKMFRRNHHFTQRKLADTVGISRRTIQQIENAHITPHYGTLNLLVAFRKKHEQQTEKGARHG